MQAIAVQRILGTLHQGVKCAMKCCECHTAVVMNSLGVSTTRPVSCTQWPNDKTKMIVTSQNITVLSGHLRDPPGLRPGKGHFLHWDSAFNFFWQDMLEGLGVVASVWIVFPPNVHVDIFLEFSFSNFADPSVLIFSAHHIALPMTCDLRQLSVCEAFFVSMPCCCRLDLGSVSTSRKWEQKSVANTTQYRKIKKYKEIYRNI